MTEQRQDTLEDTVFQLVRDEVPDAGPDFTRTSSLMDAGLDSLSLTQLLLAIEEETGVWIDESYLTEDHLRNVRTLVKCIRDVSDQKVDDETD